jgi:hypothetical protein
VLATSPELDALVVVGRADERVADELRSIRRGRVEVAVLDARLQDLEGTTVAIDQAVAGYLSARD